MAMTDPIADMLTRIRNAASAKLPVVDIPASNLKREIARVLQEKGFIKKFVIVEDGKQGILKVLLRYTKGESAIQGLQRISSPGLRHYVDVAKLPRVRDFRGLARRGFDGMGNFTLGIKEQTIFVEIDIDKISRTFGMDISFVTSAKTDDEGRALLEELGLPFRK